MSDSGEEETRGPVCLGTSCLSVANEWPEYCVSSVCSEPGSWSSWPPHVELSDTQCENLASALRSSPSCYKELDFSRNSLKESGAELLLAGLESPNCRVETLRLSDCVLSKRCCASLVSALKSSPSYLRELDLSGNKYLMDSGVKLLSAGLESPNCRLRTLRLVCCELTESSCASLLSALRTNPSNLKELDLSGNCLQDSGVKLLCAGLKIPHCTLETLRISYCKLSENSCGSLASTLKSYHSRLKELDLSLNQLRDSGIKELSAGLKSPHCRLITLRLIHCLFSDEGCASLVSALKTKPSGLTELDLSGNELQHQGMQLLSEHMESPLCQLKTLRVDYGRNLITTLSHMKYQREPSLDPNTTDTATCLFEDKTEGMKRPSSSTHYGAADTSHCFPVFETTQRKFFQSASEDAFVSSKKMSLPLLPYKRRDDASVHRKRIPLAKSESLSLADFQSASEDAFEVWPPVIMVPPDDSHPSLDLKAANTKLDLSEDQTEVMKAPSHFTPEVLNECGKTSYRFRGPCPGAYQCDSTGLVFTMTREGELLYRIVQWDEGLLQSAGKTRAGPLFNITCSEDAISQLGLPHCETKPVPLSESLSVVHISDDGMNIIEPREITETHVVVDVPHLSTFGLVWDIIKRFLNIQKPISSQVLLFHQPAYTRRGRKLTVFLLPENVPVLEVKAQQENAEYIVAPSTCPLIKGQIYSLDCSEAYKVQPAYALFDFKYGPNYHPTFEIRLSASTEEATVTVRDQNKGQVWEYHVELTEPASSLAALSKQDPASDPALPSVPAEEEGSGSSSASVSTVESNQPPAKKPASVPGPAGGGGPGPSGQKLQRAGEEERKLFSSRTEFIDRVSTSVLNDLLDTLLQNRVLNSREMESIQAMPRADRARELIDTVLRKGNPACRILIETFCEVDPFLSELLHLN
ncbi:uncharacterized protein LOC120800022 isoform X2 [Xiphias gladius]|uniref:uncharacterized protein LOC120800022 isoform X2 n=1 Tax=Xiphias gladius TaxID=8245 RepID=UPI001A98BF83|nr:uncharacterized protein LOC120800022 isoform X2 [Xiphias gladius]